MCSARCSPSCVLAFLILVSFFFFNATAPTEIYTLSLHDALPILGVVGWCGLRQGPRRLWALALHGQPARSRSEEHTSELQSLTNLVCRLLLEKKKKKKKKTHTLPIRDPTRCEPRKPQLLDA